MSTLPVQPHPATYDVLVLGGGVSGSVAAIAAARTGARVLLVEEHGFLGGSLTAMGVGPMMSFHNPDGEQVVRGIPDEIIRRLDLRDPVTVRTGFDRPNLSFDVVRLDGRGAVARARR